MQEPQTELRKEKQTEERKRDRQKGRNKNRLKERQNMQTHDRKSEIQKRHKCWIQCEATTATFQRLSDCI